LTTIHDQARNIREEVALSTVAQLTCAGAAAPPQAQGCCLGTESKRIKRWPGSSRKKKIQQADAEKADKTYNELNTHDDQFDLSDVMMALCYPRTCHDRVDPKTPGSTWSQCFDRCLASSWAWPDCLPGKLHLIR